ncbi:MAG: hypothetical protein ACFB3T_02660 [Geminicoccaceae bacterium]
MNEGRNEKRLSKLQVLVTDSELTTIDDWRFEHRSPNRSTAVRNLILLGLEYCNRHPQEIASLIESVERR